MRLIFIDESARDNHYYFFGALIADAEAVKHIEQALDGIGQLIANNSPGFRADAEFHAVDMFHAKKDWKIVEPGWRVKAAELVAKAIARSGAKFVFRGVDLDRLRTRYPNPYPAHLLTLGHLLEELHTQLTSLDVPDHLGLVLADEHHSAPGARRSLRNLKVSAIPGYSHGPVTNIADTLYFGPSHESRLLQAADVATYFFNRQLTIVESDARVKAAVDRIVERIRRATVSDYVWRP